MIGEVDDNFTPEAEYICIAKDGVYNVKSNLKEVLLVKDRHAE